MPLIAHNDLPAFARLHDEGSDVLSPERAAHQDIRELHVGLLNIMPDGALEATERQFFRLIGGSNRVAQIYIHPFTLPNIPRSDEAQAHIDQYYESFEKLQEDGLDALVITGANEETNPPVSDESFWKPLYDVLDWGRENVASTLCSCLAGHAALTHFHGHAPIWRDEKLFGVYSHRVLDREHPLVRGMNTVFNVPHARNSQMRSASFEQAGMRILVKSTDAGTHLATSKDGFRLICMQGHPEYDTVSLLKEYKRDVQWHLEGKIPQYPPVPTHYFSPEVEKILEDYRAKALAGNIGDFPEALITEKLENTWADSGRSLMATWIGLVYQTTHVDRRKLFMDGVDPENPLNLK